MSHAIHPNAALTPKARLKLARLVVEQDWTITQVARRFEVSYGTAKRWVERYLAMGAAGMQDRSSRPHRNPNRTPRHVVKTIVRLRWRKRLGPVEIGSRLGLGASTVHAVLVRCRLNRLSHIDRRTGEPIRRYEHETPGALIHVDVTMFGNIPDGGGWRHIGRQQGERNRSATANRKGNSRSATYAPKLGTAYVHTVIDDHSRVASAEIHDNEKAATAVGVLQRAVTWFAARGVTIERVLSDNGAAYKSHLWRDTCAELSITVKKTRPYRPQTNGKIERFDRTMGAWAHDAFYTSETARRAALPGWLHHYNHHRPHTAIGGQPPITRLTNVPGQHRPRTRTAKPSDVDSGWDHRAARRARRPACAGPNDGAHLERT